MKLKFTANEKTQRQTLKLDFKAEDVDTFDNGNLGRIVGLSAYFNNIDSYNEVIKQGAFAKTIKDNLNWAVLRHHDSTIKIGFNEEAEETRKGLKTTSLISLDTQDGKEQFALSQLAFKLPKAKDAQSIGFMPKAWEVEEDKKKGRIKYLTEIEMWEHSFVTWGANPKAESTGLKSLTEKDGYELGDYVDDFFKFMESVGYKHEDVIKVLKKEDITNNGVNKRIEQLMDASINLFKA